MVCVCVCVCQQIFWHYKLRGSLSAIPTAAELHKPEKEENDFAETTAFESEKLAWSRTEFRGQTHQLAVRMRILQALEMSGTADLDWVRSLCVS